MSALSFREQAAIALFAVHTAEGNSRYDKEDSAKAAQLLADECCKQWGHEETGHHAGQPTPACKRCGAKP